MDQGMEQGVSLQSWTHHAVPCHFQCRPLHWL